jgi:hypothetical protein
MVVIVFAHFSAGASPTVTSEKLAQFHIPCLQASIHSWLVVISSGDSMATPWLLNHHSISARFNSLHVGSVSAGLHRQPALAGKVTARVLAR